MNSSPVLHFSCCHVRLEQTRMQPAECLTQTDQFVLVAFVLPPQDLSEQGSRTRRGPVTLTRASPNRPASAGLIHQQPPREPRVYSSTSG
ncbi:hypothetical protein [Paraburkholderia sp. PGU19]|uniref:hypothetical protein n=1 Tax=Paraburkholderia sp. PGU19 TaxID=2735434 RepID=UPI0015DAC222|nr:hypothetical protein [Paraburkholderia sp. PGU19]